MDEPNTIEPQPTDFVESVMPPATLRDLAPEALVDAIAAEMAAGPRPDLVELAAGLGAPTVDSLCTVMSARAMLMAAGRGRAFYQHELRGRVPMPDALFPELEVWDEGTVPVWQDGVFVEPKYFSFRQDAPFAAYNPVHRRKWRPHELLHGAVGFFWRDDASRFETYVGSRLNELLPVVHWYGLDEIFRSRCAAHQGELLFREFCPRCEAAVRPYWEVEPTDRAAALEFARAGRDHFCSEMDACRDEIRSGVARETPLGRLNASTDAVGYLYGHWNRINAPSFRAWADLFLREGLDYFGDLDAYANRVEACAARLVGGAVSTTPDRFRTLRQRRILQDVGYRCLLAFEWLDPASQTARVVERSLAGALERCAAAADALIEDDDNLWDADDALEDLMARLRDVRTSLPAEVAEPLLALGLSFFEAGRDRAWELANLAEGISQSAPLSAARVDAARLSTFADSPAFAEPGRLVSRFAAFLAAGTDAPTAELAALEAWACEDPQRDEHAERFSQEPGDLEGIDARDLHFNTTMRRASFAVDAVDALLDGPFETDSVDLVAAYWQGELQVLVVDEGVDVALAQIAEDVMPDDEDAVFALLEARVVVYVPTIRRGE